MATWLRLAENSSHHREKRIGRAWTRITGSLSLSVSVSLSLSLFPTATDFSPLRPLFHSKESSESHLIGLHTTYRVETPSYPCLQFAAACFAGYAATIPTDCSFLRPLCLRRLWNGVERERYLSKRNFRQGRYDLFEVCKFLSLHKRAN